jgi:hypothetical protein
MSDTFTATCDTCSAPVQVPACAPVARSGARAVCRARHTARNPEPDVMPSRASKGVKSLDARADPSA